MWKSSHRLLRQRRTTSSFRSLFFSHDDTPLCWSCDVAVHGANFLVARHVRRLACASCRATDFGHRFSGPCAPHPPPIPVLCSSCRPPTPLPFPSAPPPQPTPTTTSSASASSSSSSRVPTAALSSRIGVALDGAALSCAVKLRGGTRDTGIARARSRARTGVAKAAEEGWGESAALVNPARFFGDFCCYGVMV
uniref:Uncharacterized protein n=1 Tax=Ananas comosus var. bracteatus TaxID=296719 RepID=A0A6V7Q6N0_ANACO|nr:unnamed protein product [Ananas comosus var. bracteatus]